MSNNSVVTYRSDIDGLRAVAVLAVVLYHFGIGGLPGGFVGVDVFYVISGFLITGIIQREIEQGRFTFAEFYERRIRRIFPALFLVLATTLVAGFFILLPADLILLGKSTVATLLFSSNIFFWRTSGYFDSSSELNPLLHTWSLAVEEQFYIGLPILLILAYRYAHAWLRPVLIVSAILSFAACLWMQGFRPAMAFYLSPFRAWELLLGSFLAVGSLPLVTKSWLRELLAWLGLAVLMASILFIKAGPEFPGWIALGPVLGTGLIIHAGGSGQTKVGSLLSLKPFVFIGLISYSLYLWHWPILVFGKYINELEDLGVWSWAGVALSIILAIFSYYFVETPVRLNKNKFTRGRILVAAGLVCIVMVVVSGMFWRTGGIPARFPENVTQMASQIDPDIPFKDSCMLSNIPDIENINCRLGVASQLPSIALWGDSFALALAPGLDATLNELSKTGVLIAGSNCPALIDFEVNAIDKLCLEKSNAVIDYFKLNPSIKTVILHSAWLGYANTSSARVNDDNILRLSFENTIKELNAISINIVIVGYLPMSPSTPRKIALLELANKQLPNQYTVEEVKASSALFNRIVESSEYRNKFIFINPLDVMCNEVFCTYLDGNALLYRDIGHLSVPGALKFKPLIRNALTDVNARK